MDLGFSEKAKKTQAPPNSLINYWQSVIAFLIVAILLGSLPCVTKQVVFYLTPPVQLSMRYMIALLFFIPSIIQIIVDLRWLPVSKNPIASDITTNSSNLSNLLTISSPSRTIYNGKLLRDGLILGLLTFGIHISLSFGVQTISANRASFLFGLCVIFVALLDLLYRKRFSWRISCSAILAFSGSGLMSWEQNSEPLMGSLWVLGAVACEATLLIMLENIACDHHPLDLSIVRLAIAVILSLVFALPKFSEQLPIIQAHWLPLLYLGCATAATTWLVIFALQTLPAVEASLIQGLEPIFGALISFLILGEVFGVRGMIGSMLVLSGTALAILFPLHESRGNIYLSSKEDL